MTTVTPVIIPASRATDIPDFYSEWFMKRLRAGYAVWTNPFNRNSSQRVSFEKARVFIFWTKDQAPLMPHLDEIERMGYHYYVQYTLNDYEREGLEPGLPSLDDRVETFRALAERIGKERVIWRFDPLLLSDDLTVEGLLARVEGWGTASTPRPSARSSTLPTSTPTRPRRTAPSQGGRSRLDAGILRSFGSSHSERVKKSLKGTKNGTVSPRSFADEKEMFTHHRETLCRLSCVHTPRDRAGRESASQRVLFP